MKAPTSYIERRTIEPALDPNLMDGTDMPSTNIRASGRTRPFASWTDFRRWVNMWHTSTLGDGSESWAMTFATKVLGPMPRVSTWYDHDNAILYRKGVMVMGVNAMLKARGADYLKTCIHTACKPTTAAMSDLDRQLLIYRRLQMLEKHLAMTNDNNLQQEYLIKGQ